MAVGCYRGITEAKMLRSTSDLFPAYELEGSQQLAGVLLPSANREPGQAGGGSHGGLAHTATHEFICTLLI